MEKGSKSGRKVGRCKVKGERGVVDVDGERGVGRWEKGAKSEKVRLGQ